MSSILKIVPPVECNVLNFFFLKKILMGTRYLLSLRSFYLSRLNKNFVKELFYKTPVIRVHDYLSRYLSYNFLFSNFIDPSVDHR